MISSLFLLSFFRYTHIYGLPDPLFVRRLPFSIPVSLSDAFIARTIHCLRELQLMIAQAERKYQMIQSSIPAPIELLSDITLSKIHPTEKSHSFLFPFFSIFILYAIIFSLYIIRRNPMLTIYQLMKYLRNHHSIKVKANQAQALRNIGYYHGFKGYRFIRNPSQRIPFTSLDEVIALNTFDMQLKTLFYPKVMFIENALISLLETETGITNLDFRYIDAYVVLITYTLRKMGETKTSCKQFISAFISCTDTLRSQLSATANVCNQILGTQQRSHLSTLQNFLEFSEQFLNLLYIWVRYGIV